MYPKLGNLLPDNSSSCLNLEISLPEPWKKSKKSTKKKKIRKKFSSIRDALHWNLCASADVFTGSDSPLSGARGSLERGTAIKTPEAKSRLPSLMSQPGNSFILSSCISVLTQLSQSRFSQAGEALLVDKTCESPHLLFIYRSRTVQKYLGGSYLYIILTQRICACAWRQCPKLVSTTE